MTYSRTEACPVQPWPKERIDTARVTGHDRSVWETVDPEGRTVVLVLADINVNVKTILAHIKGEEDDEEEEEEDRPSDS